MTLAIDIGNTNIDVALFEGEKLARMWRIFTDVRRTGDEYASIMRSFFRSEELDAKEIVESTTISSVVPSLTDSFVHAAKILTGKDSVTVSSAHFDALPIKIPTAEMG